MNIPLRTATIQAVTLFASAIALSALTSCGNTISNNDRLDAVVGPPLGASVSVTYGNASSESRTEGTLKGIGREWVGVERAPGVVLWIPAQTVRLIEESQAD